jgi:hypothetical protein
MLSFVHTAMSTDDGYDIELGVSEPQKRLPRIPEEPSSDVHGMYFLTIRSYVSSLRSSASIVQMSLRDLQAELKEFLVAHTDKILSLQASLLLMEQRAAQGKLDVQSSVQETGQITISICGH